MRILLLFGFLLSLSAHGQQFTATISYGIPVPVYTWDGAGKAIDFACNALDSADDQGTLVILGRDAKNIWYITAGYYNDASEDGWFMQLQSVDTNGSVITYLPGLLKSTDTTFAQRFHRQYDSQFKKQHLEKLIPVEAWKCPRPYGWVAEVNSKALKHCFSFYYNVYDDPDDGSCVFYFDWAVTANPYEYEREVGVYGMLLTIPSEWKYLEREDSTGFISAGRDTLFFSLCPAPMRLIGEETEYTLEPETPADSIQRDAYNQQVRHHNDSMRATYTMAATHNISSFISGYGHLVYFVPKTGAGKLLVIGCGVGYREGDFLLESTELNAKRMIEFIAVIESRRDRW